MDGKAKVSSLSIAFKKSLQITEDREEAKKEHRQSLKNLMNRYEEDVKTGKAEGIRTAKEFVEVMKMDLLLMGEATERIDENSLDEVRVQKITQVLDVTNDTIRSTMANMLKTLNDVNDEADIGTNKKSETDELSSLDGASIMADSDALAELAQQAMKDYEEMAMQEDDTEEK